MYSRTIFILAPVPGRSPFPQAIHWTINEVTAQLGNARNTPFVHVWLAGFGTSKRASIRSCDTDKISNFPRAPHGDSGLVPTQFPFFAVKSATTRLFCASNMSA